MSRKNLLIANKGTAHELIIYAEDGGFYVDNSPDYDGRKTWYEFPRFSRSVRGCKISAARIFGEPIIWGEFSE